MLQRIKVTYQLQVKLRYLTWVGICITYTSRYIAYIACGRFFDNIAVDLTVENCVYICTGAVATIKDQNRFFLVICVYPWREVLILGNIIYCQYLNNFHCLIDANLLTTLMENNPSNIIKIINILKA